MAKAKAFKMIPHCTKDTIQYEMDELVRCKECKYGEPMCKPWDDIVCTQNNATHCPDWFCADGERR